MSATDLAIDDVLGPIKVLRIQDPRAGLRAFVVVDNVACGPSMGGIRLAPDVTLEEVSRLARAMTLKNAAAGLPHGGGKAGIVGDPAMTATAKEALIRSFARSIRELTDYIPGPDMGTDETAMAWIRDEIGRAVGLPEVIGGIPLDVIGSTGFGLTVAAEVAADSIGIPLRGARAVIQGFGAVGRHAARFLSHKGVNIVAVSDSQGAVSNAAGLDVPALLEHKAHGPVAAFTGGRPLSSQDLVGVDCEMWIPAARPDVIDMSNVSRLRARLVLQGANIPATPDAERWMHEHGVLNVPDFVCNAGGVITASVEYHGGTESQALTAIEEKIRRNTANVLRDAAASNRTPRESAVRLAELRIHEAMRYQRS